MFNTRIISNFMGLLMLIIGGLMLTALPFSFYYQSNDWKPILISAGITLALGLALYLVKVKNTQIRKREGYLIVTLGWVVMASMSCLPYMISNAIPNITDAYFESMSGLTTTGASILNDIESMPRGILFWRSMTQWIGGMGIIVLAVAILPILGIGGMELFVAEAPGPTSDKLHPRIKETAKRLWGIYVSLTAILCVLLLLGGMSFYDSINHALTTMATGGFSTRQASIGYYSSPFIQYVLILFMFLAGTNYSVLYFGVKGNLRKILKSDEFRSYLYTCIGLTIMVTMAILLLGHENIEKDFRDALFQVVSVITTTGFVSADYTAWSPFVTMLFFVMMFIGASAGSTSGGIKVVRHYVMVKNGFLELKRLIHPRAIIPLKVNERVVQQNIITNILIFILLYFTVFFVGALLLALIGVDFVTSLGAVATALGNIGPGLGKVGPVDNFYQLPDMAKWLLSFLMLLGRLELFTILVLFTPAFWRSN